MATANMECPCGAKMVLDTDYVREPVEKFLAEHRGHSRPTLFGKRPQTVAQWIAANRVTNIPAPVTR